MKKKTDGHRYIERITEIVPDKERIYEARDLIVWEDGQYVCKDEITSPRYFSNNTKILFSSLLTVRYKSSC